MTDTENHVTDTNTSADKLDQSLDSIIASHRNTHRHRNVERRRPPYARPDRRRESGGGGGSVGAWTSNNFPIAQIPPFQFDPTPAAYLPPIGGVGVGAPSKSSHTFSSSIYVTNLPTNLTETDIRTIFSEISDDPVVTVFYDGKGKSLGKCEVTFPTDAHSHRAFAEFDGAEINSSKVKVQLLASLAAVPETSAIQFSIPQSLPVTSFARMDNRIGRPVKERSTHFSAPRDSRSAPSAASRDSRGNQTRGDGSRKRLQAEDLDAELEEYHKKKHEPSYETPAAGNQNTNTDVSENLPALETTPASASV